MQITNKGLGSQVSWTRQPVQLSLRPMSRPDRTEFLNASLTVSWFQSGSHCGVGVVSKLSQTYSDETLNSKLCFETTNRVLSEVHKTGGSLSHKRPVDRQAAFYAVRLELRALAG